MKIVNIFNQVIIMPTNGNLSPKMAIAIWITINIALIIGTTIRYFILKNKLPKRSLFKNLFYEFYHESYVSNEMNNGPNFYAISFCVLNTIGAIISASLFIFNLLS